MNWDGSEKMVFLWAQNHKKVEGKPPEIYPLSAVSRSRLSRIVSIWILNISKHKGSATSISSLFQCLNIPQLKKNNNNNKKKIWSSCISIYVYCLFCHWISLRWFFCVLLLHPIGYLNILMWKDSKTEMLLSGAVNNLCWPWDTTRTASTALTGPKL